jgi:hypothetical protein
VASHRLKRALLALAFVVPGAAPVEAQTREIVGAPRVQSRIRVQWDPALGRITVAVDDQETFSPLAMSQSFLTDGALAVTYPRLNPLRIDAASTLSGAGAAPGGTTTARLRALLALATVAAPSRSLASGGSPPGVSPSSPESCAALTTARTDAEALISRLSVTRNTPTVATLIESWRRAIDDAFATATDGAAAISAAVSLMGDFVADLDARIGEVDVIVTRVEGETVKPSPGPCETSARAVYETLRLMNPRARLTQLAAVRSAVVLLRETLSRDYVTPGAAKWRGIEYRLGADVRPTSGTPLTVVVRVTQVNFEVDGSSGAIIASEETGTSAAFVAQRFSRFAKEFAVGTVISTVTRPSYGTTMNGSGATVVAELPRERTSVNPGLMASFVCRCQTGPFVAPMLQVGVATSKDVPGLLAGGGIRLFGLPKGDVALGVGLMVAWVKDLRTLEAGDPVGGTSDIQADLRSVRRQGAYFSLQYKF